MTHRWFVYLLILGLWLPGCASFVAQNAIQQFSVSMQEADLDALKQSTSSRFEQMALRKPEAARDLKILKLPSGKIEIVSMEDIDKDSKKCVAKIGEKDDAKELEYKLVKDRKTGRWVVDDVIMHQQSGRGTISRNLTDQMDLLLTTREFLAAWADGSRTDRLTFCDGELHEELSQLPPNWLNSLSDRIAGSSRRSFRPEARLDGDKAAVVVPHADGKMYLEMSHETGRWLVTNVAVEPKSDTEEDTGIRSLTRLARALNQSAKFLTAYAGEDREVLATTASQSFFKHCLKAANLSDIPLPVAELLADEYEVRQFKDRMEMILEGGDTTYMLTLLDEEPTLEDGSKGTAETRIDEVTIFAVDGGGEVKRLSSMYLSHAVIQLYADALLKRDLKELQELSSADFNERIWRQDFAKHFAILPYPELSDGPIEVVSTVHRGDLTEVTMMRGRDVMTFVMRQSNGWMVVDDVLMPAVDRPTSLKANLELILPMQSFAMAAAQRDLRSVIKESAGGLDRIVWLQMNKFPNVPVDLVKPLMAEVVAIENQDTWQVVKTSDGFMNAEVRLVREGDRYVVHDVSVGTVESPDYRVELIQSMRQQIAASQQLPAKRMNSQVMQARYERPAQHSVAPAPQQQQTVGKPAFEPIERAIYVE